MDSEAESTTATFKEEPADECPTETPGPSKKIRKFAISPTTEPPAKRKREKAKLWAAKNAPTVAPTVVVNMPPPAPTLSPPAPIYASGITNSLCGYLIKFLAPMSPLPVPVYPPIHFSVNETYSPAPIHIHETVSAFAVLKSRYLNVG